MSSRMRRYLSIAAIAAVLGISLSACNTMEGLGEDTQAAGEALEEEAED